MLPRVIGITGKAGAGKDTVAAFFVQEHGYVQYSLAYPIKAALNAMFGWDMLQWVDREWKEHVIPELGKSPRQMAQTLGTEWGRGTVDENLWLTLAQAFVSTSECPVVISDVRFDNEAWLIHELGGELIRVSRRDTQSVAAHASEAGVTRWIDWEFSNDSSIDKLYAKLASAFTRQEAQHG